MEEKKKSSTTIIVILVLIIVALGGFIAYDKLLTKEDVPATNIEINESLKDNEQKQDEPTTTFNEKYQVLSLSPINGHAVLYNGEVYFFLKKNMGKITYEGIPCNRSWKCQGQLEFPARRHMRAGSGGERIWECARTPSLCTSTEQMFALVR